MKSRVIQRLKALGNTKEEIAEKLTVMGIKGVKTSCSQCPIAQYLQRTKPIINRAFGAVLGVDVEWYLELYRHPKFEEVKAIHEFIKAFDSGKYPELESD